MAYSTKLEDLIDHHFIANEKLHKKKQMGGVGYLINGNMCFGIYDDALVVRIGRSLSHSLVKKSGIRRFVPEDESQYDFIMIDQKIYKHAEALSKFLVRGIEYTSTLPPKLNDDNSLDHLNIL